VERPSAQLPEVPTEEEIRAFYQQVWQARKFTDMVLIKTLFCTGVRVSELVNIRLQEVDLERCQIRICLGKGGRTAWFSFSL
jgi:integrase/recombinase XerD